MKTLWPVRSLSELIGIRVKINLKDDRVIEGVAVTFDDITEDEQGRELIGLDYGDHIECAYDNEIESVYETK